MLILFLILLFCMFVIWIATTIMFIGAACFCTLAVLTLETRRRECSNQHCQPAKSWLLCTKYVLISSPLPLIVFLLATTLASFRIAVACAIHSSVARRDSMTFALFPEEFLFQNTAGKFVITPQYLLFLAAESFFLALSLGLVIWTLRRTAILVAGQLPRVKNKLRMKVVHWLAL